MIGRLGKGFRRDESGASVIEFALVAPVMFLLLFGFGDLAYQGYMHAVLTGAVQAAGRKSGLPGGGEVAAAIDADLLAATKSVNSHAEFATGFPKRQRFKDFTNARQEPFDDPDNDGYTPTKDCFYDLNGNGSWDSLDSSNTPANGGKNGQGNADDVVLYTVAITYPRLFPIYAFLGWSDKATLTSSTVFKNQPYTDPSLWPSQKVCP